MSLGNTIRHGALWLFLGNTGQQLLTFAFGIVLARLLAPEDFGMLVTIQVFTGLAGFVAGGGMGQALVRAKSATKHDYDVVFTLQLLIGCIIYSSFFIAAPQFADWYKTPLYADLLRVSALTFIMRPLVNVPASILHRDMRFKAQTGVKISTLLTSSSVSIGMAYAGYGVWSLIMGGIAGSLMTMMILIPLTGWRPGINFNFRQGRDLARYGMLVSANDILNYLKKQASVFILSRTLGPASVGLFNKGSSLAQMPHSFITGSVYQVLFRSMAVEQDNIDKCRYLFYRSIALVAVYATPFYVGLLWLAEPMIRGVYGEKWIAAAGPLAILPLAWPFMLLENLSGAVLAARNWLGRELLVQSSAIIVISLAILIGLSNGIDGVAYAIVGSSIFSGVYMYSLAVSSLKAKWSDCLRAVAPAAILNTTLAIVLYALDSLIPVEYREINLLYVAIMGFCGACAYAASLLFFPIASLRSEQARWKKKLRLPMRSAD